MPDKDEWDQDRSPTGDIHPPADRHYLTRLRLKSPPKEWTTIILPGTDVAGDLAAIRNGEAVVEGNTYSVNGRTWGRKSNGTLYPIAGDGFIGPVSRNVFKALIAYRRYNGINDQSGFEIDKQPFISAADREMAQRLWRLREEARDGPESRD